MSSDSATDEARNVASKRLSFGVGNLLLLIALVSISLAWWVDHNRSPTQKFDVVGPVSVSYTVRTSPNSTSGGRIDGVTGIDFQGDNIVVHTTTGGTVFLGSKLIAFRWDPE